MEVVTPITDQMELRIPEVVVAEVERLLATLDQAVLVQPV